MECITITANLSRSAVAVKAIRTDEIPNFFQNILNKHKQIYGTKYTPIQIIALINLSKTRILRMRGKVWDQLVDGDSIWLVTNQEWQEYCENVLEQEQLYRHGKRIVHQHPNSLGPEKLQHFVSQYYENSKPVDPLKKFSSPPPPLRSSPPKKPLTTSKATEIEGRGNKHILVGNISQPKAVADAKMIEAVRASLTPKMNLPPSTIKKATNYTSPKFTNSSITSFSTFSQPRELIPSNQLQEHSPIPNRANDINELYSEYKGSYVNIDLPPPININKSVKTKLQVPTFYDNHPEKQEERLDAENEADVERKSFDDPSEEIETLTPTELENNEFDWPLSTGKPDTTTVVSTDVVFNLDEFLEDEEGFPSPPYSPTQRSERSRSDKIAFDDPPLKEEEAKVDSIGSEDIVVLEPQVVATGEKKRTDIRNDFFFDPNADKVAQNPPITNAILKDEGKSLLSSEVTGEVKQAPTEDDEVEDQEKSVDIGEATLDVFPEQKEKDIALRENEEYSHNPTTVDNANEQLQTEFESSEEDNVETDLFVRKANEDESLEEVEEKDDFNREADLREESAAVLLIKSIGGEPPVAKILHGENVQSKLKPNISESTIHVESLVEENEIAQPEAKEVFDTNFAEEEAEEEQEEEELSESIEVASEEEEKSVELEEQTKYEPEASVEHLNNEEEVVEEEEEGEEELSESIEVASEEKEKSLEFEGQIEYEPEASKVRLNDEEEGVEEAKEEGEEIITDNDGSKIENPEILSSADEESFGEEVTVGNEKDEPRTIEQHYSKLEDFRQDEKPISDVHEDSSVKSATESAENLSVTETSSSDGTPNDISTLDNMEEDVFDRSDREFVERKLLSEFNEELSKGKFDLPPQFLSATNPPIEFNDSSTSEENELYGPDNDDFIEEISKDDLGSDYDETNIILEAPITAAEKQEIKEETILQGEVEEGKGFDEVSDEINTEFKEDNGDESITPEDEAEKEDTITESSESEIAALLSPERAIQNERFDDLQIAEEVKLEEIEVIAESEDLSFCVTPDTEELGSISGGNDIYLSPLLESPDKLNQQCTDKTNNEFALDDAGIPIAPVIVEAHRVDSIESEIQENHGNEEVPITSAEVTAEVLEKDKKPSTLQKLQSQGLSVSFFLNSENTSQIISPGGDDVIDQSIVSDASIYTKFRRQSDELAELKVEKAELQARLEETRYLLQMFAGLTPRHKFGSEKELNLSPFSSFPNLVDELEDTIKDISVEMIDSGHNNHNHNKPEPDHKTNSPDDSKDSSISSLSEEKNITKARRVSKTLQLQVEEASLLHNLHFTANSAPVKVEDAVQTDLSRELQNAEIRLTDEVNVNEVERESNVEERDQGLASEDVYVENLATEEQNKSSISATVDLIVPVSEFPTVITHDVLHTEQVLLEDSLNFETTDRAEKDTIDGGGSKSSSLVKKIEALKMRRKHLTNSTANELPPIPPVSLDQGTKRQDLSDKIGSPIHRPESSIPIQQSPSTMTDEHGVFTKPRTPKIKTPSHEKRPSITESDQHHQLVVEDSTDKKQSIVFDPMKPSIEEVIPPIVQNTITLQAPPSFSQEKESATYLIDPLKVVVETDSNLFVPETISLLSNENILEKPVQPEFVSEEPVSPGIISNRNNEEFIEQTTPIAEEEDEHILPTVAKLNEELMPIKSTIPNEEASIELPKDLIALAKHCAPVIDQSSSVPKVVTADAGAVPQIVNQKKTNLPEQLPVKDFIHDPLLDETDRIKNDQNQTIDFIYISRPEVVSPLSMNSDLLMVEKTLEANYDPIEYEPPPIQSHTDPQLKRNSSPLVKTTNNPSNTAASSSANSRASSNQLQSNNRGGKRDNIANNEPQPLGNSSSQRAKRKSEKHQNTRNPTPTLPLSLPPPVFQSRPETPPTPATLEPEIQQPPTALLEGEQQLPIVENIPDFVPPLSEDSKMKTNITLNPPPSNLKEGQTPLLAPIIKKSPSPVHTHQPESIPLRRDHNDDVDDNADLGKLRVEELSEEIESPKIETTAHVVNPPDVRQEEEEEQQVEEETEEDLPSPEEHDNRDIVATETTDSPTNSNKKVSIDLPTDKANDDFDYAALGAPSLHVNLQDLEPLVTYHYPFLISSKYLEDSNLRGWKGRKTLLNSIQYTEIILWIVFQLYGTTEGILVKQIKSAQISRLLLDSKIMKIASTQLDLQLVKIHAKLSAQKAVSHGVKAPIMTKTGTMAIIQTGKKVTVGANPKTDPSALNCASFVAFAELLKSVTVTSQNNTSSNKTLASTGIFGSSSSITSLTQQSAFHALERLAVYFRDLLLTRDLPVYEQLNIEAKISISGILLRTPYARYLQDSERIQHIQQVTQRFHMKLYSDQEIELVRQVWERNIDQIRLIYSFYAAAVETRRFGSGTLKLLLNVDNCKEMLQDFQILPQLVDVQTYHRLFRSCKLWEWEIGEYIVKGMFAKRSPSSDDQSESKSSAMGAMSSVSKQEIDQNDPYDFKGSIGHFSLSLWGFMEILSRIACFQNKLGHNPSKALENLFHLMDASNGKNKLLTGASRKSISVRHFTYAPKK